jgi:hypothetical protein
MRECRLAADSVFNFVAKMLFQGLTSAVYVGVNSSDWSLNSTAALMVRDGDVDVEWGAPVDTVITDLHVHVVQLRGRPIY